MRGPLLALLVAAGGVAGHGAALPVDVLQSIGGLPAHLAGAFEDITACHLTRDGNFVLFDRREHAVFTAEPGASKPRKIVQIGFEPGRVLRPLAFDSAPDGTFVIADAPSGRNRIQFFVYSGGGLGGFTLPGPDALQITLGNTVVSGIASLEYTGPAVLLSLPENGRLVTEYANDGRLLRTFGELRPTGQEHDPDVHAALNVGLPLADPHGGFYYVFISGVPMFRKYDAAGDARVRAPHPGRSGRCLFGDSADDLDAAGWEPSPGAGVSAGGRGGPPGPAVGLARGTVSPTSSIGTATRSARCSSGRQGSCRRAASSSPMTSASSSRRGATPSPPADRRR
jgi:hypothetical protein